MTCPIGTSRSYTGDETNVRGCRCPSNYSIWTNDTKRCNKCPNGTSLTNTGGVSNIPGCKCGANLGWNSRLGSCQSCPSGSSITNSGSETDVIGCYCPLGSIWSNGKCQQCLAGQYATTMDNSCRDCPIGTYTSTAGTANYCTSCPDWRTTKSTKSRSINDCSVIACKSPSSTTGTGQVTSEPACKCPSNYIWNSQSKICEQCPNGTNLTYKGMPSNISACKCPPDRYWENNRCNSGCPAGTSSTNMGLPLYGYDETNCYCPNGQSWVNGACTKCANPSLCRRTVKH